MWSLCIPVLVVSITLAVPGDRQCEWGKYGEHCNLTCPVNCALVQSSNLQHCNRDTGKCSEGCQRGWHGDLCDQSCSPTCLNKTCNLQTGHCTLGCNGTSMGVFCNSTRKCGRGWYGDTCEHPCSSNCVGERCNQTTGVCVLGCRGTYTGDFCNITTETSTTPAAVNNKEGGMGVITIPALAFLIAAVAVALAIVAASVVRILRWWRHKKSSQRPATADGEGLHGDLLKEELQKTENSPLMNNNHGEVKDAIVA